MARYIDADKFAERIKLSPAFKNMAFEGDLLQKVVLDLLDNAPAADVVEVKHGEWIQEWELEKGLEDNDEIPYIKCSLCGHTEWHIDKERNTTPNYCSDCGAKMKNGS